MELSIVEIVMFIMGSVAAVVVFIHRLRMTVQQKMNKQAYRYGHYAVSFFVAGLLEVLFCIALKNGVMPIAMDKSDIRILMCVSGITLFIGIWNMICYYMSI